MFSRYNLPYCLYLKCFKQGCQNRDFVSGHKGIARSKIVKSQSKSKDFTLHPTQIF